MSTKTPNLFSYASRFVSLTREEEKLFMQHLQVMTSSPKQVLTKVGDMEQHVYFIQKGLVRKFFYRDQEEVTVQISMEGDLVSSSVSFLSGVPSEFVIETLEPCTLAFFTKSSLETMYDFSTNFEKMGRLISLEWMLYKERWDIIRMVRSPRDRFIQLLAEKPGLLHRVPQKYIASMLNIKPETLSRYKKLMMDASENA